MHGLPMPLGVADSIWRTSTWFRSATTSSKPLLMPSQGRAVNFFPHWRSCAPSEAWCLLQGESPCRVRNSQPPVPSVGVLKEAAM